MDINIWSVLVSLVIGMIAGWIAGKVMNRGLGLFICVLVGVVGGFLGNWVFSSLGLSVSKSFWGQVLVGFIGSVLLLFVLSFFRNKD